MGSALETMSISIWNENLGKKQNFVVKKETLWSFKEPTLWFQAQREEP
jgi:hypothetical protein